MRELSETEFLLLQTSACRQSKPPGMNCPASQGDEPQRSGGAHTHGGVTPLLFAVRGRNDPFVSPAAAIMPVLFPLRNDTWVGNPSGSSSPLPCKAEEFCLRTDSSTASFKSLHFLSLENESTTSSVRPVDLFPNSCEIQSQKPEFLACKT